MYPGRGGIGGAAVSISIAIPHTAAGLSAVDMPLGQPLQGIVGIDRGMSADHGHTGQHTVGVTVGSIGIVSISLGTVTQDRRCETIAGQLIIGIIGIDAVDIAVVGRNQATQRIVSIVGGILCSAVVDGVQLTVAGVGVSQYTGGIPGGVFIGGGAYSA